MQGDMHFSHDHPLSLFVDKLVDDYEDYKSDSCKICGLLIVSSPSYICTTGCGFFLHKSCAETFPQQFIHPTHAPENDREKHSLHLQEGSPNQCEGCTFQIHPLVAIPHVEIKTKHKSHPSHPLVVFCKQISCECDACGKKQDGFFFSCQLCNFLIHQDCTVLPSVVTLASRPQPFLLTYSLPTNQRDDNCVICGEFLFLNHSAIYYCFPAFAHVSCAMEKIQSNDDSVQNMQGDMHFSHDHPLSLFVDNKQVDDYEDERSDSCKICGLPILSSPSYICTSTGCGFFLHKSCAETFPQQLRHPSHHDVYWERHTLHLLQGSPNFTYQCEDCSFQIHPLVAVPHVEIKTKHKSHPSHPLAAVCKQISCECDACGKVQDGFFFCCQLCNFWIHQDCTILPSVVTLASRPQPFLLTYSLPRNQRIDYCVFCREPLFLIHNAIYFCVPAFAHVSCAMEKIQSKTRLELIQLPDDDWETSPSSFIRGYSQSMRLQLFPIARRKGQDDKLTIEKFHDHPLILVDDDHEKISINSSSQESTCDPEPEVCDVCIQTINVSSPYYRCALHSEKGCPFLAHKICADLLPIIQFAAPRDEDLTAQLCPDPSAWFFNAIFYCFFCHLPCNGPCYYFPSIMIPGSVNLPIFIDLECMAAPNIIKHASHSQHLLYRTTRRSRADPISCCASDSFDYDVYRCIFCSFYIHVRCACLPKRVRHEFDKHPADLITTNGEGVDLCEVCETDVDLRYWHYRCNDCDYSFHINCIPKIGYLSKVKYGGTLSVSCHTHPLTLTRMLSVGRNEKCGHCKGIIGGFVDEMAFCCSLECGFWIHFSCARDSTASGITDFRKVEEQLRAFFMARIKD